MSWFDDLIARFGGRADPVPAPAPAPAPEPVPVPVPVPEQPAVPAPVQPAPEPALTPPQSIAPADLDAEVLEVWNSWCPIFGPVHPGLEAHPGAWQFPDTANTSSTEDFIFADGWKPVRRAEFIIIWQPSNESQWARIIEMPMAIADGYGTWTEVCKIQGLRDANGWGPRSFRFDATAWLRQQRLNRINKYIGFQVCGDGAAIMLIWKVRLLIEYEDES